MTLCQTVAFALMGWYIVLPPSASPEYFREHHTYVDTTIPLARWYFYNERKGMDGWKTSRPYALVLGSQADCEAKLKQQRKRIQKFATVLHRDMNPTVQIRDHAMCVSSDDPRLKSN